MAALLAFLWTLASPASSSASELPGRARAHVFRAPAASMTHGTKKAGPLATGYRPVTWVGVAGFEPAASSSRTKRAAKLRYTPPVRNLGGAGRVPDSLAERQARSGRTG